MMDAEFSGFDELERRLIKLGPAIGYREMFGALTLAGNIIRKRARATLEGLAGSGALAAGLIVRRRRTGAEPWVQIGTSRQRFYGMFLEFGTAHIAPKPFLRPAAEENQHEVVMRMAKHLRTRIEKLVPSL